MGKKQIEDSFARRVVFNNLKTTKPSFGFNAMRNNGTLGYIVPELTLLNIKQSYPHKGTVWQHTMAVVDNLPKDRTILRLAGLLHDVGKPQVIGEKDGKITFYFHERPSAQMARRISNRLGLKPQNVDYISDLIANHMIALSYGNMRTEPSAKRFISKMKQSGHGISFINDLFTLNRADVSTMAIKEGSLKNIDRFEKLVNQTWRSSQGQVAAGKRKQKHKMLGKLRKRLVFW